MAKNARNNKKTSYVHGMLPTKERQQKQDGVISEPIHERNGNKTYVKRYKARAECTLDHYQMLKKISDSEYEAGMIFARAYMRAVLHVSVDDISGSHGDVEMSFLTPIHSERLLREAYDALSKTQKAVVIDVCGHDYGVGTTDRLEVLKRGLSCLAKLWRLS